MRLVAVTAVLVASMALSLGAVVLGDPSEMLFTLPLTLAFLASPTIGALIVLRRPDNRIGWLFCGMGLAFEAAAFAESYGYAAFRGGLPGLQQSALVAQFAFLFFIVPGVLLIVLFPTGRLPSRRWLLPVGVAVAAAVVAVIGQAFGSARLEVAGRSVPNPYRVPDSLSPALTNAGELANMVLIGSTGVLAVAMVLRLRRAQGIERQQLKWFVLAAVLIGVLIPISSFLPIALADVAWIATLCAFGAGLPIAAGIAILRHRLYDIDLLINRTLVYGSLTVLLGGLYVALVLGLQVLLAPLTGTTTPAVAISTLAVAAAFGPARRRIQLVVDRRFYRSRYDAQRTLEAFASRLRDEIDPDSLTDALRAASRSTVQPASASVWLRADR